MAGPLDLLDISALSVEMELLLSLVILVVLMIVSYYAAVWWQDWRDGKRHAKGLAPRTRFPSKQTK
ncbi:MAG: hypothetical protein HY556_06715 [Euryarchaeota archaeon]|nr:hypothetical protein [Euryarchaeota archaeon]